MDSSLFKVTISVLKYGHYVDIPIYSHNGKKYLYGPKGKRFQIWIDHAPNICVEFVISIDGLGQSTFRPASLEDRGRIYIPSIDTNLGIENIGEYEEDRSARIPFRFWKIGKWTSLHGRHNTSKYVVATFGVIGIALYFLKPKDGITLSPEFSYQDRLDFFERTTEDPVEVQIIRYEKSIENLRSLGIDIPARQPSRGLLERENLEAFPLSKVSQEV